MRRALRFSALLLGMLAISSHVDARGGGGGFGGGFSRGFIHVAPSAHAMNGFHRQSIVRRRVFAARQSRQRSAQTVFPIGGGDWLPDWGPSDSQIAEYPPAPDPLSQPQVIVIHPDNRGPTVAEAAPDYGYIPGCQAIPNGYHCDPGGSAR